MAQVTAREQTNEFLPQLYFLTVNRTVINTSFRMVYPLLPVLARSVNVELAAIATVLTFTNLTGLLAPALGLLAARRSNRFNIVLGLILNALGLLAVFVAPNFTGLAVALLVGGIAKVTFDPAVSAYVGDRVPYERRGFVMGIIEISWSAAFLIGVPLMTLLIDRYEWRAPFITIAVLSMMGSALTLFMLETDNKIERKRHTLAGNFRVALASPSAWWGLLLGAGISAANQLVNLVFAAWIEASFGIVLSALAVAAAVIGASELLGEGVVARFADSFGKQRLIVAFIVMNMLACLLLPFSNINLTTALAALFLFYLSFEIALVTTVPLATEVGAAARATYLTVYVAVVTLGRALFTPVASFTFEQYGLLANCVLAVLLNGLAIVAVMRIHVDEA